MVKILGHYFHRRTLIQMGLDFGFVVITLLAVTLLQVEEPTRIGVHLMGWSVLLGLGVLVVYGGLGFYQRVHNRTRGQTHARTALGFFLSIPLAFLMWQMVSISSDEKAILASGIVAVLIVSLLNRIYVTYATPSESMRQRVLILGSGKSARSVGKSLKKSDPNVDLVGYFASPNETKAEVSAWGLLATNKSLADTVAEEKVDEIVVALTERRGGSMPLRELLDCKLQGVRVVDVATHFEKTLGQIRLDSVSAGWLIFGDGFGHGWARAAVKRVFDIVCATILILVTLPIMVVTGVLILLESGGPMLYLQPRVGLNGRIFNVVKFRSMRTDAESDGTPRWATAGDDRVTRVGRIIRKLRIDELPQLYSVLDGAMSLVGPRPERPFFVDKLTKEIPFFSVRQSVKPGVTGWAQVRYQYGASVEDAAEKLQYDLYYVKNHNLFLDIIILFETVSVVLMRKGAQ